MRNPHAPQKFVFGGSGAPHCGQFMHSSTMSRRPQELASELSRQAGRSGLTVPEL